MNAPSPRRWIATFWRWYERHERLGVTVATFLFLWQLVHLLWLTTDVVFVRLFGTSPILTGQLAQLLLAIVDYIEIPALIATSLVYLNDIRKGTHVWRALGFLILLNSQWIHLTWITDEFVVHSLVQGHTSSFSPTLAWVAIGIDHLELPVMVDVVRRWLRSLARR